MNEYLKNVDVERREAVWFSPCPGIAHPGIVVWRRFGFVKVLYWDRDGLGYTTTSFMPSSYRVFPRNLGVDTYQSKKVPKLRRVK